VTGRITRERRQSLRYALQPNVFIVFNPYPERLGKLKDVGRGGVGFEYLVTDNSILDRAEEVVDVKVDIFIPASNRFLFRSLPCKVVYDIKIEQPTLSGIQTRRCGLKFDQLSQRHNDQLKQLIDSYASHSLPFLSVAANLKLRCRCG
jgi:hypothetical protein